MRMSRRWGRRKRRRGRDGEEEGGRGRDGEEEGRGGKDKEGSILFPHLITCNFSRTISIYSEFPVLKEIEKQQYRSSPNKQTKAPSAVSIPELP